MVLHHVAQRAGLVVELATHLHAQRFGHRDLYVADAAASPQRFEQCIAEAQRQQVLHRFLAEIVVDAEDLRLAEDRVHVLVDLRSRGEILSQRLFQHHARAGSREPEAADLIADAGEQRRRGGEKEDALDGVTPFQDLLQGTEAVGLGAIRAHVVQLLRERRPLRGFEFSAGMVTATRLDQREVSLARQRTARDADHARIDGELFRDEASVQGRQQLAHGEIASATEQDQIKTFERRHAGILRHGAGDGQSLHACLVWVAMSIAAVPVHPTVVAVTQRIVERSRDARRDYLERMLATHHAGTERSRHGCANLAHGFAASGPDKDALRTKPWPNIAIVSAYNDMLSAHQPYERFPALIRAAAREVGAVAQFAGGVPAMCDGVTQGTDAMDLSLFSRDVIAMSTAVALSHNMFDAALLLGICDKIVPGPVHRCHRLRPPAHPLRAQRTDVFGHVESGEITRPQSLRAGQGHAR